MKRLFSLLLCLGLIACMSAVSFASDIAYDLTLPEFEHCFYDDGTDNTLFGILPTSELDSSAQAFMIDFFSHMTGESEADNYSRSIMFGASSSGGNYIEFVRSSVSHTYMVNAGASKYKKYYIGPNASMVRFSKSSSSAWGVMNQGKIQIKPDEGYQVLGDGKTFTGTYPTSSTWYVCLWSDGGINYADGLEGFAPVNYIGSLGFVDDDGLLSGSDEPDEPEEPSSSEPSSSIESPTVPDVPTIQNDYIPYDTSLWNGFLEKVLDYIRKAAKIGLYIFGILCGLWLIKRVVKIFVH